MKKSIVFYSLYLILVIVTLQLLEKHMGEFSGFLPSLFLFNFGNIISLLFSSWLKNKKEKTIVLFSFGILNQLCFLIPTFIIEFNPLTNEGIKFNFEDFIIFPFILLINSLIFYSSIFYIRALVSYVGYKKEKQSKRIL